MQNHYTRYRQSLNVLGLEVGATFDEAEEAYWDLIIQWHPDRFAGKPLELANAEEQIERINIAFQWLKQNRSMFDREWDESERDSEEGMAENPTHRPVVEEQDNRPQPRKFRLRWWIAGYLFCSGLISLGRRDKDISVFLLVLVPLVFIALFITRPRRK